METGTRVAESTGRPDMRYAGRRKVTTCVRLDPQLLADIDASVQRTGTTRTALVEEAVRFFLWQWTEAERNVKEGSDE